MKVLVSGCSGFIGSNLTPKLIKLGHEIEGISRKLHYSNYKIHPVDLCHNQLEKKIRTKNFDAIIHLAADTNEKDFHSMFGNNVIATLNILEFARKNTIKKFVFVSGHNVYSLPATLPIKENSATEPSTNYGYTKFLSENLVTYYNNKFNLGAIILRVSVVYGNGKHRSVTLSKFINNYKNSRPIFLHKYKNGFQKVDLIHVSDVCNAIIKALKSGKKFGIYNVASGKAATVQDIVKILKNNIKSDSKIMIKNIGKKTMHFYYDIKSAKSELNFEPKISLEEGITNLLSKSLKKPIAEDSLLKIVKKYV